MAIPKTYYVDATLGSDANDGESQTADGEGGGPWQTIHQVNSHSSLVAGDAVLFKRGETWREQLTVPSSGSAGSVITFGAYGTGDDPIFDGADVLEASGWTANLSNTSIWTAGEQSGAAINVDSRAAHGWRNLIKATSISANATSVRFKFTAHPTESSDISNAAIGLRSGTSEDYTAAGTQITFGGLTTASLANGATVWSDWITYTIDKTKDYLLSVIVGSGKMSAWWGGSGLVYYTWATNNALTADITADGSEVELVMITEIESQAGIANVWQRAATTQPYQVYFNGTKGTNVASIGACNSARKWYWVSNVLYVYSTSDPATAFTAPGVEVTTRGSCVRTDSKNYIVVDGLNLKRATIACANFNSGDHNTIQNCSTSYSDWYGILFGASAGAGNHVKTCDVSYNMDVGILPYQNKESTSSDPSYIQTSTVQHNGSSGVVLHCKYWIAENNEIYSNGQTQAVSNGLFVYRVSEDAAGIGTYNVIRYNKFHDHVKGGAGSSNDGGGILFDQWTTNNAAYYNLCYGNAGPGISTYGAATSDIWNNVCYGNNKNATGAFQLAEIRLLDNAEDISTALTVKNNAAQATEDSTYAIYVDSTTAGNTVTITNNDWLAAATNWYYFNTTAGANLATWNGYTGVGTDLNSDPLFVSTITPDFALLSTSPCINAGVDVGLTTDYAGNPVGPYADIGAYEFQGGAKRRRPSPRVFKR